MNNLLKVSALFLAVGLASCGGNDATKTTETTTTSTMSSDSTAMGAPMATDTAAGKMAPMGADTAASKMAPAAGTSTMSTSTTENKMTEEKK